MYQLSLTYFRPLYHVSLIKTPLFMPGFVHAGSLALLTGTAKCNGAMVNVIRYS